MTDLRYVVGKWHGEPAVIDTSRGFHEVIAVCTMDDKAAKIAAALNGVA